MEKYIYKIVNKITGLIYIGQTKNLKNRWYEHCLACTNSIKRKTSKLYNAMYKYGIYNFVMEAIEGPIENYNEREKYWIDYYNTYKGEGYNLTPGGDEPPIIKGDKSCFSVYNGSIVSEIQNLLINSNLSYEEIGCKLNVSVQYVSLINRGEVRKKENLTYPLRNHANIIKSEKTIREITYFLLYSTKSIEEISRILKVSSKVIYKVNKGEHSHCLLDIEYPIRQPYAKISTYIINNIYQDLLSNELKFSEIEQKYSLSKSTVNRINQGKIYKNNAFSYPLRSSSERVYN